jgi:xylose isomerase
MPMQENHQESFAKASKTIQKQMAETEKKIGDAAAQAQSEFMRTFEDVGREVMSCAAAEMERGLSLSKKLSGAQYVSDALTAYQEWLSEEMNARTEDARRFMAHGQKFMSAGTRAVSNGWSGIGTSS